LVPAIQASHADLSGALKTEAGGVLAGSSRSRLRSAFVLVQVSLSFVLLAGTALLLQSLQRIQNASPGFSTDVLTSGVDLFSAGYNVERAKTFHTQLLDRVRELPSVESATLSRVPPFTYLPYSSAPIEVDGYETKLEGPRAFFYVPLRQNWSVQNYLLIRTRESAGALLNALAHDVHTLDPIIAPRVVYPLQENVDRMSYTQRLAVTLVALFGGMALFLAAIGLYAVMSYSVSQGTRELGLRMALGASMRDLLQLVLSHGLRLTI